METISVYNPHQWGKISSIDVPVRWKRREWGGWTLVHAKTGRVLGWITRDSERPREWQVRLASQPFRGDEHGDGDILDKVPVYLYNGDPSNSCASRAFCERRTRWDAAYAILTLLVQRRAPAVGFPRHPDVDTTRSDRYRKAMSL